MDTLRTRADTLNYFQQSPVRGQLEPPDGTTGDRRFIQCTDIPNELKVSLVLSIVNSVLTIHRFCSPQRPLSSMGASSRPSSPSSRRAAGHHGIAFGKFGDLRNA